MDITLLQGQGNDICNDSASSTVNGRQVFKSNIAQIAFLNTHTPSNPDETLHATNSCG